LWSATCTSPANLEGKKTWFPRHCWLADRKRQQNQRDRIIRAGRDGGGVEIPIDLKAIEKKQAVDVVLIPNDIVDVPSSTGKRLLNALPGAIAPTLANTAVRAIP
jgi:hypothetical protein